MNRTIFTISLAAALTVVSAVSYSAIKRIQRKNNTAESSALDTLNELATASGNDSSFATTITPVKASIEHYFDDAFAAASSTIDFKNEYHNGTGYFNDLCTIALAHNEVVRTTDDNGRKIIVIGSGNAGKPNAVVFQRYTDQYKIIVQMGPFNLSASGQELKNIFDAQNQHATARAFLNLQD